jgi:hypothetical protein
MAWVGLPSTRSQISLMAGMSPAMAFSTSLPAMMLSFWVARPSPSSASRIRARISASRMSLSGLRPLPAAGLRGLVTSSPLCAIPIKHLP